MYDLEQIKLPEPLNLHLLNLLNIKGSSSHWWCENLMRKYKESTLSNCVLLIHVRQQYCCDCILSRWPDELVRNIDTGLYNVS